jgi:Fe-S-cluster containining protein
MVCQKGCSHCCHISVDITSLEARYIQTNLGINVVDGKSTSDNSGKARIPCSFLSGEGICTIYEHRPYACRTYHAIDDPKYCELLDVNHMQYTSESNGMLNKLFLMIVDLNGNKPIRDIRDFFPNGKA